LRWLTEFARPTLRARIYILHPHLHPRPRYETKPSLSTNYYSSIAIRANLHPSIIVRFAFRFTNSLVIRRFGRRFLQIRGNLSRSPSRDRVDPDRRDITGQGTSFTSSNMLRTLVDRVSRADPGQFQPSPAWIVRRNSASPVREGQRSEGTRPRPDIPIVRIEPFKGRLPLPAHERARGRWTVDGGRWTVDGGRWTVDGGSVGMTKNETGATKT